MSIPDGTYDASIREWGLTETKNGSPQVYIMFDLGNGAEAKYTGTLDQSVVDKTGAPLVRYTISDLRRCGFASDDITDIEITPPPTGYQRITLVSKTSGDKTYQNVYIARGPARLDDSKATALKRNLAGLLRADRGQSSLAATATAVPQHGREDSPF